MTAPTIPISVFDSFVLPFAQQAPRPLVSKFVRLAAIEFCERTRCWREIVTVNVTDQNAAIVAPDHASIHEIEEATFDGRPLTPTQFTDTTLMERQEEGHPRYITQTHPNTVALIPFEAGSLTLSLFLKPRSETQMRSLVVSGQTVDRYDVVPEFMFNQYAQKIADGALARLLMVPGQAFSNPQEGMRRSMLFNQHCDAKFATNITMQHRAPPRVRMTEY
jgi:hypothetical protein